MVQADYFAISFDLGMNFNENTLETEQATEVLLPDAVIADLMQEINENQQEQKAIPDGILPLNNHPKKNHFAQLSNEQIDTIAANNHAPKTKNQMYWGVKVFQGK